MSHARCVRVGNPDVCNVCVSLWDILSLCRTEGAYVSPQVLVATVILRRDSRCKQQARLLKLQEDKEDFYKKVIEMFVQKDRQMDFKSR